MLKEHRWTLRPILFPKEPNIRVTEWTQFHSDTKYDAFMRENVGSDTIHPIEEYVSRICMGKRTSKVSKTWTRSKQSPSTAFGWIFSEDTWLGNALTPSTPFSINLTHYLITKNGGREPVNSPLSHGVSHFWSSSQRRLGLEDVLCPEELIVIMIRTYLY